MAASSIGGRCTFVRTICRTTLSASTRASSQSSHPSIRPNFAHRLAPSRPRSASPRLLRREWSSLVPFHSAIASACLVSKLPSDVNTSTEGRFANYVSPI